MDPHLWRIDRYRDFLEARKELLAEELNNRMAGLLHGDTRWLEGPSASVTPVTDTVSGISSEEEEAELEELNDWVEKQGLPRGELGFEIADDQMGQPRAVVDLAWRSGLQEELSQPVAVMLNESPESIAIASEAGYRCFTSVKKFKTYVRREILAGEAQG
jgi:hypothetical protein